jgi:hypothetical protein
MNNPAVIKDERTRVIEREGDHLGFILLAFGVMIDIFIRSAFFNQAPWDLFALVILASWTSTVYQAVHKTLPPHFLRSALLLGAASALLAAALVFVIVRFR